MITYMTFQTTLAILTGILGIAIGYIFYAPSAMSLWTSVKPENGIPKGINALLGISGLSIIPLTLLITLLTYFTQNINYLWIYMVPIVLMWIGIIVRNKNY